eukprot:3834867-Prymnesium_polylepis.1
MRRSKHLADMPRELQGHVAVVPCAPAQVAPHHRSQRGILEQRAEGLQRSGGTDCRRVGAQRRGGGAEG